ncbi:MAG: DNA/RNA non-specific endonuclease [Paracoccus sp. (in: a-proteobacteria)]|uniref:DNA/RNA non-specific endonuclease n=1 Tax=Paracoccus sp. TaxID=267 RepID=UPI004058AAFE
MLKRRGEWRLDGRLHPDHQVGNEVYRRNPLDRGHMVRRRDPDGKTTPSRLRRTPSTSPIARPSTRI